MPVTKTQTSAPIERRIGTSDKKTTPIAVALISLSQTSRAPPKSRQVAKATHQPTIPIATALA
jgi:hypothetical protein